jgi:heme-degrading monooxygenase HmoA
MFVRTTSTTATQEGIDRGIRYVRDEVLPALMSIDGYVGLSALVDRATGRCITASAWESASAMRASESEVQSLRQRFVAASESLDATVEEWEVALMHRRHPAGENACARVSWLQGDPFAIEDSIDSFRAIVPALEKLPGFASASLLIDRATARAVSTVVYDTADDMARSRPQASDIRARVADETGTDVLEVAEFDLAVAQLRVPELV